MTLKTRFLVAAAALTLPALAGAQPPAPTPPASAPPATRAPRATPPAPANATTPPTQQSTDATETRAQQPENIADDQPVQQTAETPPPATTPQAATPAPAAQAQMTAPPATTPPPVAAAPAQARAEATTPPAAPAATGALRAAAAADLHAGVQVRDQQGGLVGTIESADSASAVIYTGTARGRLALTSFGYNGQGLVISMTRAQLEAAITASHPG